MIVITAPTATIGHQVLENVIKSGEKIRVITRDPAAIPAELRQHVEVVEGSHGDANVVHTAFEGADALFWLAPPDSKAKSVQEAYVSFTRPGVRNHRKLGRPRPKPQPDRSR